MNLTFLKENPHFYTFNNTNNNTNTHDDDTYMEYSSRSGTGTEGGTNLAQPVFTSPQHRERATSSYRIRSQTMLPLISQLPLLHEKVANLIELYLVDYNHLASQMDYLYTQIQNAEESESLRLDSSRNQLMIVNAILSVLTCIIGFCAYITGAFGMNLDQVYYLQPIKGVFNAVFCITMFFIPIATVAICWGLMKYGYIPI